MAQTPEKLSADYFQRRMSDGIPIFNEYDEGK